MEAVTVQVCPQERPAWFSQYLSVSQAANGCCFHQVCWEFTMQLELLELLRSITVFVSQPLDELVPDRFGQVCGQWGAMERFL